MAERMCDDVSWPYWPGELARYRQYFEFTNFLKQLTPPE